ncbi:hypothetical protein BGZ67_008594 [Mortierella alpina]|nr:hypothetical protein BGZ67_008594 [Mortierella alpina]
MDTRTGLSEPKKTEGSAAPSAGLGNTDTDRPCRFVDLLFETILFEKASSSRTTSSKAVHGSVHVEFKELAKAFDMAKKTCETYCESHPNHAPSAALGSQLAEAGLALESNLRDYVVRNKDCGGIFRPRPAHGSKQEAGQGPMIVLPPGDLSDHDGFDIPALETQSSFRAFDGRYAESDTAYHDMIARIVYTLRRDLWHRSIVPADLDRVEKESIYRYGSRFIKARGATINEQKAAGIAATALRKSKQASSVDHMEMISQQLKGLQIKETEKTTYALQGAIELPVVQPTVECYEKISAAVTAHYGVLVPSPDYMSKRSRLVRRLQSLLNSAYPGAGLRLEVFGQVTNESYASGLGSESSDADLCITSDYFQKTAQYNDMRSLAQVLRRGGMIQIQTIAHARVPIVKFVDPQTRINCDVNANHVLGIHNSELIRCYTLIDDRVRPFIYNLKAIVKKHRINDSSQAWLSSYAYVMMAIGFLQAQDPPILPALQAQPQERMTSLQVQMDHEGKGGKDLIDCTFDRDYTRYQGFGTPNTKSVGQLLIEFFEFYTRYYDYQTMEVNVRLGGGVRVRDDISKFRKMAESGNHKALRHLPQKGKGEKKLIVMDPFIHDRNVAGSCTARNLTRVWKIFEFIYLTLSHGEFQRAFEVISEYEGGQQEQPQTSNRRQGPGAASDSHRSREKKTERKHERKRDLLSKPAAADTSKSTTPAPQQDRYTMKSESAELQTASVPAVVNPPLATAPEPQPVDKKGQEDVEEDDEQPDGDDHDADGLSKSRKRRLRRSVARTLHAPHNTTVPSASTAQRQEASASSATGDRGSQAPSTLQAARQHNAKKEQQQSENATERAFISLDAPQTTKPTRRVVQTDLIKHLQEQKRHNDQLDQSRTNVGGSATAVNLKVQPKQRHHQQPQQQQSMYPVLAKTHKILLAKTKNADEGVSAKKGGGANSNGGSQGSKRGSRSKDVQVAGLKEGL